MDNQMRRTEAFAIRDGKFKRVGSTPEVLPYRTTDAVSIDLKGKTVLPGFIDTHQHMMSYSVFHFGPWLDVNDWVCRSIENLKESVGQRVKTISEGDWIIGRGWTQQALGRYPNRWDLDEVAPNNPVLLRDCDGHSVVVNSLALKIAGIEEATADPHDAEVDRDSEGNLTGIFREYSQLHFLKFIKNPSEAEMLEIARRGLHSAASYGYTSIGNIQIPWAEGLDYDPIELRPLFKLHQKGQLPIRVRIYQQAYKRPTGDDHTYIDHLIGLGMRSPFGDDMLKIQGIKIVADGWPSSYTSYMRKPWADRPSYSGSSNYSQEQLDAVVRKCHENGWQLLIHASGDRASDMVLDAYEKALRVLPDSDHRHRLEHAFLLHDDQIERIVRLRLLVGALPIYIQSERVMEIIAPFKPNQQLYGRYKTLMDKGVRVHSGSDCHPMGEGIDPIRILKKLAMGWNPWAPKEKLTVEEALRTLTINAAYAHMEEDKLGSIEEGKLADLVVLSGDPLMVEPVKIDKIRVETTIVGGKIVYERKPL
jgi:predicted amidohydrolase YtcJ